MDLEDKKVAILGLGIEGTALADFLFDKVRSITVLEKMEQAALLGKAEGDLKKKIEAIIASPKIEKVFGEHYLDGLDKFDIVFRSPAIYFNDEKIKAARDAGVEISSQIKLFFELCPCQIIGVTGTKGKGTTASLIYEMLKHDTGSGHPFAFGPPSQPIRPLGSTGTSQKDIPSQPSGIYLAGNIGYPAITLIPELDKHDIVILELSNFQLADLDRSPHIAVVTNLTIDHLDYHKDEAEYRQAKFNILRYQSESDFAVLNTSSTFAPADLEQVRSKKIYFSKEHESAQAVVKKVDGRYETILDPKGRNIKICDQAETKLLGRHNQINIAAAVIAADLLHTKIDAMREVAREFAGLPHRLEFVAEINGVRFINDSFATNPGPTMAAIDSFDENKILILGGSKKGNEFRELAEKIAQSEVRAVVLIGVEAEKIKQALRDANFKGKIVDGGDSIEKTVRMALYYSKEGDVVIFSPACASFDMFKNYKDRGEKFKAAVLNLGQA